MEGVNQVITSGPETKEKEMQKPLWGGAGLLETNTESAEGEKNIYDQRDEGHHTKTLLN